MMVSHFTGTVKLSCWIVISCSKYCSLLWRWQCVGYLFSQGWFMRKSTGKPCMNQQSQGVPVGFPTHHGTWDIPCLGTVACAAMDPTLARHRTSMPPDRALTVDGLKRTSCISICLCAFKLLICNIYTKISGHKIKCLTNMVPIGSRCLTLVFSTGTDGPHKMYMCKATS